MILAFFKYAMSTKDIPRVYTLKRKRSREVSNNGWKLKSKFFIFLMVLGAKILYKLGRLMSQRLRMTSGKLVDYI